MCICHGYQAWSLCNLKCCNICHPCLVTVALSWHRWTRLKRCGCRSGNMKKTEHVPSTGRPSNRSRHVGKAPRTALKSPPSYCRRLSYSCTCHLRVPLHHPLSNQPLLNYCQPTALPPYTEKLTCLCVIVSIITWFFFSISLLFPLFLLLLGDSDHTPTTIQTVTFRGASGYLRGQWLALWTLTTGPAILLFSPHWSIGIALLPTKPCKV